MQLATYCYCYFCHTKTLLGGAPSHRPDCEVLRIIDEALATAKQEAQEKEANEE
jgi:hypothetical protein